MISSEDDRAPADPKSSAAVYPEERGRSESEGECAIEGTLPPLPAWLPAAVQELYRENVLKLHPAISYICWLVSEGDLPRSFVLQDLLLSCVMDSDADCATLREDPLPSLRGHWTDSEAWRAACLSAAAPEGSEPLRAARGDWSFSVAAEERERQIAFPEASSAGLAQLGSDPTVRLLIASGESEGKTDVLRSKLAFVLTNRSLGAAERLLEAWRMAATVAAAESEATGANEFVPLCRAAVGATTAVRDEVSPSRRHVSTGHVLARDCLRLFRILREGWPTVALQHLPTDILAFLTAALRENDGAVLLRNALRGVPEEILLPACVLQGGDVTRTVAAVALEHPEFVRRGCPWDRSCLVHLSRLPCGIVVNVHRPSMSVPPLRVARAGGRVVLQGEAGNAPRVAHGLLARRHDTGDVPEGFSAVPDGGPAPRRRRPATRVGRTAAAAAGDFPGGRGVAAADGHVWKLLHEEEEQRDRLAVPDPTNADEHTIAVREEVEQLQGRIAAEFRPKRLEILQRMLATAQSGLRDRVRGSTRGRPRRDHEAGADLFAAHVQGASHDVGGIKTCDLHEMRVRQAILFLERELPRWEREGFVRAKLITGRGRQSHGPRIAPLKADVLTWLRSHRYTVKEERGQLQVRLR